MRHHMVLPPTDEERIASPPRRTLVVWEDDLPPDPDHRCIEWKKPESEWCWPLRKESEENG